MVLAELRVKCSFKPQSLYVELSLLVALAVKVALGKLGKLQECLFPF